MRRIIICFVFFGILLTGRAYEAYATKYGASGDGMNCGLNKSQQQLDTPYFVAINLNGIYSGGLNCGRWIRITFGQECVGGNQNWYTPCTGQLVTDSITGKSIDVQVQDSCPDGGWCTQDTYHLDISENTILDFGGQSVLNAWNNRKVTWEFIQAPSYTGNAKIYFGNGGNPWWPKLVFSHLKNGLSKVESFVNGAWRTASIIGTSGATYVLYQTGGEQKDYQVKLYDSAGQLYGTYSFQYPSSCGGGCGIDTLVQYQFVDNATSTPTTTTTTPTSTPTTNTNPTTTTNTQTTTTNVATTSVAKSPNYTGFATYFISSSTAVGNCGISADLLPDVLKVGLNLNSNNGASLYAKGANCGRWVEFKLGKQCVGSNLPLCQGGQLQTDLYTDGVAVQAIVFDSQGDSTYNSDIYHLNIQQEALKKISQDVLNTWNNREVKWNFIEAPSYTGDIKIYIHKDANKWWPYILITNLKNGISKVQRLVGSSWQDAKMNTNLGQAWILPDYSANTNYEIRVFDSENQIINNKTYKFNYPYCNNGLACGKTVEVTLL